jgi:hypothetical protein
MKNICITIVFLIFRVILIREFNSNVLYDDFTSMGGRCSDQSNAKEATQTINPASSQWVCDLQLIAGESKRFHFFTDRSLQHSTDEIDFGMPSDEGKVPFKPH